MSTSAAVNLHRTGRVGLADSQHLAEVQNALDEHHLRLSLAARVGGLGVWDYDIPRAVLTCDAQWHKIMGRKISSPITTLEQFQAVIHPEDRDRATEVQHTARQLLSERKDYGIVFRIVRPDGEIRWVRSAAVIIDRDGSPVRAVGFVVDVTDSWLAEQNLIATNALLQEENKHLLRQTLVDALTGIANRRRLDQELERACLHAARARQSLSIALMDIDHFKAYNDHYGHPQGDRALALVAESIASAAWRPYDVAARYGGEEFAVLLPGSSDPGLVMEKIRKSIEQRALPHEYSPTHTVLTISCGCLTTSDPQKLVPNYLLEACDELLYRAKTQGRNCLVLQTA